MIVLLKSEEKLRRYDALTADDVEEMGTYRTYLKRFADQVDDLDPPQKYRRQYEASRAAIGEMYAASLVSYNLAADPLSATRADFQVYRGHVDTAFAYLRSSNEMLDRESRTVKSPRESGP